MSQRSAPSPLAELVDTLWYERRLLEFLLFKLVSANLVLSSGDRRFVGPAIDEVEQVLDRIRRAEGSRHTIVAKIAKEWGIPSAELSLAMLTDRAPDPFARDLHDCRLAFARLVDEIDRVSRANRQLATVGVNDLRTAFGIEHPVTYKPPGETSKSPVAAVHVDRRL